MESSEANSSCQCKTEAEKIITWAQVTMQTSYIFLFRGHGFNMFVAILTSSTIDSYYGTYAGFWLANMDV